MRFLLRGCKSLVTSQAKDDAKNRKSVDRKKLVARKKKPLTRKMKYGLSRPNTTTTTTRQSTYEGFSDSPSSFDVWWDDPVHRSVLASYDSEEQVLNQPQDEPPAQEKQSWWDILWNGKRDEASESTSLSHGHDHDDGHGQASDAAQEVDRACSAAAVVQQDNSQDSGISDASDSSTPSHTYDTGGHHHSLGSDIGSSYDSGSSYSGSQDSGSSYDTSDSGGYDSGGCDSGGFDSNGFD